MGHSELVKQYHDLHAMHTDTRWTLAEDIWCQTQEKLESWTAGKTDVAAEDRTGWRNMVCGLCSTGSDKANKVSN